MSRIVLLAPDDLPVPPLSGGSVQIYLHNLLPKLNGQSSVYPILISPGKKPMPSISHVTIPATHVHYRKRALRTLKRIRPDVVQIENRPQWLPEVKKVVPTAKIVLNLHSLTFLGRSHIIPSVARSVLQRADAVTLNSHSLRKAVERKFNLSPDMWKPSVIYPGAPLERFRKRISASESGSHDSQMIRPNPPFSASRPLRILYVGRVIWQKGIHTLIDAIRLLHNAHVPVQLTIVGRTPPWEAPYAKQMKLRSKGYPIRFAGFVIPSKLPHYYWKADILVCPSQGHEAFGLVNVEAMAAGLPVVGSQQGGIAEIVNNTCGVLVKDYRRPKAFASAIRRFIDDPTLLPALQEGAIRQSSKFSWSASAARFARLYERL